MTEASPVTHIGFLDAELYQPESVGGPVAQTECRVLDANENEVAPGELGELVMRGPQIMQGYWKSPDATAAVLRDGWYWSGDIVRTDELGLYYVVDRRKEMIKYKGFSIAPAEVESRAAGTSCGARLRRCWSYRRGGGRVSLCLYRSARYGKSPTKQTEASLREFVAERLTHYKMPREVHFVQSLPRTASGKILRRELLRKLL